MVNIAGVESVALVLGPHAVVGQVQVVAGPSAGDGGLGVRVGTLLLCRASRGDPDVGLPLLHLGLALKALALALAVHAIPFALVVLVVVVDELVAVVEHADTAVSTSVHGVFALNVRACASVGVAGAGFASDLRARQAVAGRLDGDVAVANLGAAAASTRARTPSLEVRLHHAVDIADLGIAHLGLGAGAADFSTAGGAPVNGTGEHL